MNKRLEVKEPALIKKLGVGVGEMTAKGQSEDVDGDTIIEDEEEEEREETEGKEAIATL